MKGGVYKKFEPSLALYANQEAVVTMATDKQKKYGLVLTDNRQTCLNLKKNRAGKSKRSLKQSEILF